MYIYILIYVCIILHNPRIVLIAKIPLTDIKFTYQGAVNTLGANSIVRNRREGAH